MSDLKPVKSRIRTLRRRREMARHLIGHATFLTGAIWIVLMVFLIDVLFEMTRVQRLVVMAAAVAGFIWVYRTYVRPWLAQKEDDIDVALLIQRRRNVDSDLVAAIQFESPGAATWGSLQMEQAVIQQVAEVTRGWSLITDGPQQGLRRRLGLCGGTLVMVILLFALFPRHTGIFLTRMAMGGSVYPTETTIDEIAINNERLRLVSPEAFCPIGRPVDFRVTCTGVLPEDGRIAVRQAEEDAPAAIPLLQDSENKHIYTAQLQQMVGSLEFRIHVGDARTEWIKLTAMPPPIVQPVFKPTLPDYARKAGVEPVTEGLIKRNIAVYEGSRVDLEVRGLNNPLESVALVIKGTRYLLKPRSEDGKVWDLPVEETPLEEVTGAIDYEIEAYDRNQLPPADPIRGKIRLEEDRLPSIDADIAKRKQVYVLPMAQPVVNYRANDDYGIGDIRMQLQITRAGSAEIETKTFSILPAGNAVTLAALPMDQAFQFDLSPFGLAKGDEVVLILEAVDYRGKRPGKATASQPISLKVSDQVGVLGAFTGETDAEAERIIRQIIHRATGIENVQP